MLHLERVRAVAVQESVGGEVEESGYEEAEGEHDAEGDMKQNQFSPLSTDHLKVS